MQIDKLRKVMAYTTSDNDSEALNATRQANKILKEANKTWSEVIGIDSTEENRQLRLMYNDLAKKYNQLLKMVAAHQAARQIVTQKMAPRRMPRRRTPRF